MTETIMTAILVAVPSILTGIGTLIVSIRNGHKSDTVSKKADEIHVLVNSNLTAVKADLALALERVSKLEKLLLEMTKNTPAKKAEVEAAAETKPH